MIVNPIGTLTYTADLTPGQPRPEPREPEPALRADVRERHHLRRPRQRLDPRRRRRRRDVRRRGPDPVVREQLRRERRPARRPTFAPTGTTRSTRATRSATTRTTVEEGRLGYQAQYDPNDPLRKILLTPRHGRRALQGHDRHLDRGPVGEQGGRVPRLVPQLRLDRRPARHAVGGRLRLPERRRPTATTAIFGDLGNDWLVGGTGRDTLWGGSGNDLLNADDNLNTDERDERSARHEPVVRGLRLRRRRPRRPDREHRRRPPGRLGGEYNSYLVPFNAFGMATVNRAENPALQGAARLARSEPGRATRRSAPT